MTAKGYVAGTHRAVPPEMTLRAAEPAARSLGVTRCADVTGLDAIGIPVFCSIRPRGRILQVANGKGCRAIDARVSALMEAIEHACVERPPERIVWASVAELRVRGAAFADPAALQGFDPSVHFSEDRVLPWLEGETLPSEAPILLPAPFVHPLEPSIYSWSTNGLASGNDVDEATLHGLYEVCERHALSLLVEGDTVQLDGCQSVDLSSVDDAVVAPLIAQIGTAGCRLVLLRVDLDWKVSTFLAMLLDPAPYRGPSIVNLGSGAHLSPTVAATRAITEAAQSRLTFIHGSREDLPREAFEGRHRGIYEAVAGITADTRWGALPDHASPDLTSDLRALLDELALYGFTEVLRARIASPGAHLAVVKMAIVGASMSFP